MRPLRPVPTVLLLAALVGGCSSHDTGTSSRFRPPPAAPLAAGPCALVADDVVALGKVTYDLQGVRAPDQSARDAVALSQQRVQAVAENVDPATRAVLTALVTRTGAVRIQIATGRLEDDVLLLMRQSYQAAVVACSAPGAATPTPTTG